MSDIKSDIAELLTEKGIPFERDVNPLAAVPEMPGRKIAPENPWPAPPPVTMPEETTVRARLNGGEWSEAVPLTAIQQTLSDTLFPPVRRADTPMVKVSLSGTMELTQEQYQAHLDGARLGPGAVVEVRAVGYVVQPGAAWVRRTEGTGEDREVRFEREGRVKIRLVDIGELSPTGEEWSE